MAHEILAVKLCELDEKIGRMYSRVQMSESVKHSRLKQEIEVFEKEYAEEEMALRKKLQLSRAGVVTELSKIYEEIAQIIQKAQTEQDLSTEGKILLAEYALDFAMQAADRALLLSMKAIDAQMTQQEQEERSFL